ncbi:hypothetical protein QT397_18220 [Microbulbifer sp. MKSA007]|nr:hypothetical protein QT397_18220 [Microbulbifer sp. MKSA007]
MLKRDVDPFGRLLELDVLGSFDFFTNSVCLNNITPQDFEILKNGEFSMQLKVVPLAVHEYTHFLDATSSLWGLRHLVKMNKGYLSNNKLGGEEVDFYWAKEFLDHVKSLRLPDYYTLIQSGADSSRPWTFDISIGSQFDQRGKVSDKPVLFSWFKNGYGQPLARSPLSMVSLLEASAMSQELLTELGIVNSLDADAKVVEMHRLQEKSLSFLYNHHVTEYTVCVHILANHLQCSDIYTAFRLVSVVVRVVLNFPLSLFVQVLDAVNVEEIFGIPRGTLLEIVLGRVLKTMILVFYTI